MEKEANQVNPLQTHSQRSVQWMAVHSWLESLDKKAVVKSKEISDWLSANPKVKEQLYSRHSRYHLMHYIQKCHSRMLKRREKGKSVQHSNVAASMKVNDNGVKTGPGNASSDILKDNNLYLAKRNEAVHKYELLTELEDCLSILLSKSKQVKDLKEFVSPSMPRQGDADSSHTRLSDKGEEEGRTRSMSGGESHSLDKGVTSDEDLGLGNH